MKKLLKFICFLFACLCISLKANAQESIEKEWLPFERLRGCTFWGYNDSLQRPVSFNVNYYDDSSSDPNIMFIRLSYYYEVQMQYENTFRVRLEGSKVYRSGERSEGKF